MLFCMHLLGQIRVFSVVRTGYKCLSTWTLAEQKEDIA